MKSFRECKYSAFISYAHADDEAHAGWITKFSEDLERILKGACAAPPGHSSRPCT